MLELNLKGFEIYKNRKKSVRQHVDEVRILLLRRFVCLRERRCSPR